MQQAVQSFGTHGLFVSVTYSNYYYPHSQLVHFSKVLWQDTSRVVSSMIS
ncbi:hypothetical protein VCHA50P415_60159 [Vibrio chagasii]|nr:hypothetical protein VCHA27O13_50031 [Vibrio chagasii]CAK3059437.1 hypothetical protein VCRA2120E331_50044 [Vibrio crassostreae]CAH6794019.1 hypothetical protein VCHA34P116_100031 [Vibrio chagasii]CAH6794648.1 hypothetical protein VCHA35O137_100031 [Vibrio chagasii]CAH6796400.1 hypothetical protein VCHA29O39_100032 [Vibrio chagasii]